MGLLKLAHTKSVPGADDFLPVFIYVLIMANPPYLLSTIQVMLISGVKNSLLYLCSSSKLRYHQLFIVVDVAQIV
mgnify:CR=1 FL=1